MKRTTRGGATGGHRDRKRRKTQRPQRRGKTTPKDTTKRTQEEHSAPRYRPVVTEATIGQQLAAVIRQHDPPSEQELIAVVRGLRALHAGVHQEGGEPPHSGDEGASADPSSTGSTPAELVQQSPAPQYGQTIIVVERDAREALGAGATQNTPKPPFFFNALEELDEAVTCSLREFQLSANGKQDATDARHEGYMALRRFLIERGAAARLLAGNPQEQIAALHDYALWLGEHRKANGEPLSQNSRFNYWRNAQRALEIVAERHGVWCPFDAVKHLRPKAATPQRPRVPLNRVDHLLDVIENYPWRHGLPRLRNVAIAESYLALGLRRGELVSLKYSDVDLSSGKLHLHHTKGRNGGTPRDPDIPDELLPVLRAYWNARLAAGRTEPEFFVSLRRPGGIGVGTIQRIFKQLRAVWGGPLFPHMLRRTNADLMRVNGVPVAVAAKQSGHSDVRMQFLYSEVSPEEQSFYLKGLAVRGISALVRGAPDPPPSAGGGACGLGRASRYPRPGGSSRSS